MVLHFDRACSLLSCVCKDRLHFLKHLMNVCFRNICDTYHWEQPSSLAVTLLGATRTILKFFFSISVVDFDSIFYGHPGLDIRAMLSVCL